MIFVVHGAVAVGGRSFSDGETWHGEGAVDLTPGEDGATLLALRACRADDARRRAPIDGVRRA